MLGRLRNRWRDLANGLWFFPGLVVAILTLGSIAVGRLDARVGPDADLLFGGGPEAARVVLSTIAGSLVTIVALTFSITIVVLQLAATQYTPRVLRQFLGDRTTQLTAGYYVGVFVYCLLALRTVRNGGDGDEPFVPAVSVTLSIVLAVGALALLIAFISNIATLIQVANVAPRIAGGAIETARRLAERSGGREWAPFGTAADVHAPRAGYVQRIAPANAKRGHGHGRWWVEAAVRVGDFVHSGDTLARVWPGERVEEVGAAVESAFHVANERDLAGDPGFGLRQLADIAIRALSPSVNDPTTAAMCVGYARDVAVELARLRPGPLVESFDDAGLAFRVDVAGLEELIAPLREIGGHAVGDARVAGAVAAALADVAAEAGSAAIRRSALDIVRAALGAARLAEERRALERLLAELGE